MKMKDKQNGQNVDALVNFLYNLFEGTNLANSKEILMLMAVAQPHVKNMELSVAMANPFIAKYVIFYMLFSKKRRDEKISDVLNAVREQIINSI